MPTRTKLLRCFLPLLVLLVLLSSSGTATVVCDQVSCRSPHDSIPRFDLPATLTSVQAGRWSDPATWDGQRLPVGTDKVAIHHIVTYDALDGQAGVIGVVGGSLLFETAYPTRLTVDTIMVLHNGNVIRQESPGAQLTEIVFRDTPLDTTTDPEQYSNGLIVIDSTITLHGAPLTSYVRVAAEPKAEDTTLALGQTPTGWRTGHTIVLPDSRHLRDNQRGTSYQPQQEERLIASQAGQSLALTTPLTYGHPGAQDRFGHVDFLPHAVNLSRTMVIRSANPAGTRGHVFITGLSQVDIQYIDVNGLGRTTTAPLNNTMFSGNTVTHIGTNQIGRYAFHLHHVRGDCTVIGNVIQHTKKWGIALHDTHYCDITDNVVYDAQGWGIGNEQGNESFNIIQQNFVLLVRGPGGRGDGRAGFNPPEFGYEGSCYWFRGANNYFDDNICANALDAFSVFLANIGPGITNAHVPSAPGADTNAPGEYIVTDMTRLAPLSFTNLEIYGGRAGLSVWNLGAKCCTSILPDAPLSVLRGISLWHLWSYGWYGYGMSNVLLDRWVQRGDAAVLTNSNEPAIGLFWGDYLVRNMTVLNADLQGLREGMVSPSKMGDMWDAFLKGCTKMAWSSL